MDNIKRIAKLKEEEYQELFGVKKTTFDKMSYHMKYLLNNSKKNTPEEGNRLN